MMTTTTKIRKPRRCESCDHPTSDLRRDTVDAPTAALRDLGHAAGIAPVTLWRCTDAQGCLHRMIRRDTLQP